ncbi:MAG: GTP-binding protein [Methanobacteriota archaeon]|nr:MAG: GTP-binding protein [Euryarchaeota archaeon]
MGSRPGFSMPTVRRMKAKLALMGEGGVGKTSLIRRFVLNEYQDTYLHTIGTKVSKIELAVPYGADVEVQLSMSIFDIMGQRGFRDLVKETYYHGAQALMGVCDLTRKDSLHSLNDWIPSALEVAGDVPVFLVVNKRDLRERQAISEDDIRTLAEPFRAPYIYTSARTGEFVEDAFNALAIEVVDRAFQLEQARAVERGLREKVLSLLEKRRSLGLTKNQFFEILRGVNFDDLKAELTRLEGEGLVTVMWSGASDFTVFITPQGAAAGRPVTWEEE